MSRIRDRNLVLALTKAIADIIAEGVGGLRSEHLVDLLEEYEDSGNAHFSVKLPDGTKVATITLPEKKKTYEVDDKITFLK